MNLIIEVDGASSKVELDDATARSLTWNEFGEQNETKTACIRAFDIIRQHFARPRISRDRHSAAMAILRDKAMEQAIQISRAGDDTWNIERRMESILDAVLGK